ncbi:MAG: hypothetical protein WD066_00540 [Planctomycetaceae bacterium]
MLRSVITTVLLASLALGSGCTGTNVTAFRVPNVTDPPYLAPERQALRPVTPANPRIDLGAPASGVPGLAPPSGELPELIVPDLEPFPFDDSNSTPLPASPAPIPGATGPQLPLGPILPTAAAIDVEITAPEAIQAGSGATYRLTIRNTSAEPLADVVLSAEFDDALVFPGREEKAAEQTLGTLAAGERKDISLTLVAGIAGRHCARFSVSIGRREAVWKSVCTEFLPRRFELELHGPAERTIGSRAEFTVVVVNATDEPLADVRVTLNAPPTFRERAASASVVRQGDALAWSLGDLKPRERIEIQAEYECREAAQDACVTVAVTGGNIPEERRERCLQVVAVRGILDLRVHDTADPLAVGDETEFVATVHNRGLQAARDVRLDVEIPPNFELVSTEVREDDRLLVMRHQTAGRRIEFDGLPALASERTLIYRIRARALAAGPSEFRARLAQGAGEAPVEFSEPVLVRPN